MCKYTCLNVGGNKQYFEQKKDDFVIILNLSRILIYSFIP